MVTFSVYFAYLQNEMLIFMEYCEDGTIAEVSKIGLPEEIIRVYTQQIVKAVRFVHEHGIVHRDIKGIVRSLL